MLVRSILLLGLMGGLASAADPIPKSDGSPIPKKGFVFPQVTPKVLPPAPAPVPGAVPILTGDTLYVIPSEDAFLLFDSPRGLVTVTRETGPVKIRGKFLDGNGKVETRTYSAKNIAIIEAAPNAKGRVELIAVPAGTTDEANAVRMLVDLNQAPQPPPDPKPVDPVVPPVINSFRVIWIHESGATIPQAQVSVMDSVSVRNYLTANTTKNGNDAGWRKWDKDTNASEDYPVFRDLWAAIQPKITTIPCVAIEVNGKVDIQPFPKTPQDAIALLKKFNGGK